MRELGTTIVTGGSSGLGEAVALAVADEGGTPVVLDRQYPHTSMSFEHVDISDRKEVERAAQWKNTGGSTRWSTPPGSMPAGS